MGVKKLKPITPGQRFRVVNDFEQVTAAKPEKSLVKGKTKSGGRNNSGRMTMRYVGGGHKQKVRTVDFKREKFGIPATVKAIEYDPLRSAYLMLLVYADGEKRYSVAVNGVKVGDKLVSGKGSAPEAGNALNFTFEVPKTASFINLMAALGLDKKKSLFIVGDYDKNLYLSSRNLQGVKVVNSSEISTYDIMNASEVVLSEGAVEKITAILS